MMAFNRKNGIAAAAIVAIALTAPALGASLDGAHIVNSGSTNTRGWEIRLRSDGSGWAIPTGGQRSAFTLGASLTARFFDDVKRARNAHAIAGSCMKSASFGSRTWVYWHTWQSGDLSCPSAGGTPALAADVSAIEAAVGIQAEQPGRMIRIPTEPRRPERTPPPSSPKNAHP